MLHPKGPDIPIVSVEPGRSIVAYAAPDPDARARGESWAEVSWAFVVEPLGETRSRFVSRYRCACSDDVRTRFSSGPTLMEPIGFAMDRKMLRGVKKRAERRSREWSTRFGGRHGQERRRGHAR